MLTEIYQRNPTISNVGAKILASRQNINKIGNGLKQWNVVVVNFYDIISPLVHFDRVSNGISLQWGSDRSQSGFRNQHFFPFVAVRPL